MVLILSSSEEYVSNFQLGIANIIQNLKGRGETMIKEIFLFVFIFKLQPLSKDPSFNDMCWTSLESVKHFHLLIAKTHTFENEWTVF